MYFKILKTGNLYTHGDHEMVSKVPTFAVIMAGGRGERFWPECRIKRPKQLLNLFGEMTLIEQTVLRLQHIKQETGLVPGLAVLRFNYSADADRFIEKKKDIALTCGVNFHDYTFDASCKTEEVQEKIRQLNKDPSIHGIVVKTPLPRSLNQEAILSTISPIKDVDGCCNTNEGRLLKLGENKRRAAQNGKADDIHYFNVGVFPFSDE